MLSSRPTYLESDGHFNNTSTVKTPSRILKGRSALQENALHNGAMTGNIKGKKVALNSPFQPRTLQPERLFKGPLHQGRSKPSLVTSHAPPRPLLDKTPFTNRAGAPLVTPLARGPKIAKLPLSISHTAIQTPGAFLRPSSTRKHIRVPRSASKSFETPQSQGQHWDVSDISIEGAEVAVVNESIEEEDCDDIEYMPPSAVEPQYQPMFDMPDYKTVGDIVTKLTHSYHFDDEPLYDTGTEGDIPLETDSHTLSLPELDDDNPLRSMSRPSKPIPPRSGPGARTGVGAKRTVTPSTAGRTATRSVRPLPGTRSVSRPPTVTRGTAAPGARTRAASSSRPGTAASTPARQPTRAAITATTVSAGCRMLSATNVQKGIITSTIPLRRPATSTFASKSSIARNGPTRSVASTPSLGGRNSGKAIGPVDEDLVLKFDSMSQVTADGADDFKFDI